MLIRKVPSLGARTQPLTGRCALGSSTCEVIDAFRNRKSRPISGQISGPLFTPAAGFSFCRRSPPLTRGGCAQRFAKSMVFRLLYTLERCGMVEKIGENLY